MIDNGSKWVSRSNKRYTAVVYDFDLDCIVRADFYDNGIKTHRMGRLKSEFVKEYKRVKEMGK